LADIGESLLGDGSKRALSAILFISASTNAMDVYSALNSSPWTAESFGGDPRKAAACREYVYHSIAVTSLYALAAAFIARNIWPLIGQVIATAYMWWLYDRALKRAVVNQSTGWSG
jgi:hypothetical protein